jgi:hypothetical protein
VLDVAAVAAVASYDHAYDLVRAHGESGWTAHMVPLTADGLIYTSSMVRLDAARAGRPVLGQDSAVGDNAASWPAGLLLPEGCLAH